MSDNNKLLLCIVQQLTVTNLLLTASCKNDDVMEACVDIQKDVTEILEGMKDEPQENV